MNQIIESNDKMVKSNSDLEKRVSKLEKMEVKGPSEKQVKDIVGKSLENCSRNYMAFVEIMTARAFKVFTSLFQVEWSVQCQQSKGSLVIFR